MAYKAVIFDLDGTLLDTLEDLTDSVNHVLAAWGYAPRPIGDIRRFVGNGIRRLMIRAFPDGEENPAFEQAFSMFKDYYLTHNRIKTRPYDGILPLLRELHGRGVGMAVVSNKHQPSVDALCREELEGLIETAFGDAPGRARKPDPQGVRLALERLGGIDPSDALYVGDSEVDAKTAANLPMDCVLCAWGFRPREVLEALPHKTIIEKPEELLPLLSLR